MNTNYQTIHQMGTEISEIVRQATGRNPVQSMGMDWVSVEQLAKYIYGTKTGSSAEFTTNIPDGIIDLIAFIEYVQDLNGYDYPWPAGASVNQFPDFTEAVTQSGITITPNADGSFTVTGTNGGSANYFDLTTEFDSSAYAGYVFTVVQTGQAWGSSSVGVRISASQADRTSIQSLANGDIIEDNGTDLCLAFRIAGNYALPEGGVTFKLMLAPDDYTGDFVPYRNVCPITGWTGVNVYHTGEDESESETYTVTWETEAGTVYIGYMNITTGVLTVTHKYTRVLGTGLLFDRIEDDKAYVSIINVTDRKPGTGNIVANYLRTGNYVWGIQGKEDVSGIWMILPADQFPNLGSARQYVTDNPLYIVYELKDSVSYTLDPVEVESFIGTNTIYADTGDVSVQYKYKEDLL